MPLTDIDTATNTIGHVCNACGAEHGLPLANLRLGHRSNPNQITLPPCECGAHEVLLRAATNSRPEVKPGYHRQLVSALGQLLLDRNQVQTVSPPAGDPGYGAGVIAGHTIGPAVGYSYAQNTATDGVDYTDPVALASLNGEGLVHRAKIQGRVVVQTQKRVAREQKLVDARPG